MFSPRAALARRIWTAFVLVALLAPMPGGAAGLEHWFPLPVDKLVHVALFAPLAWLWHSAFAGSRRRRALAVFGVVALLGGATELLQALEPGRSSEWADLAADLVGGCLGLLLPD
ncbi:MAG: VanZ family protein [Thermoanaerobaculia bacterium]